MALTKIQQIQVADLANPTEVDTWLTAHALITVVAVTQYSDHYSIFYV